MCLVLFLGSVMALLSFLSSYTYPVPKNSCDWSLGLSSSMSSCLGTRVTYVGAHDIFLSLLAWCELSYSPCKACRNLCHFCKVCRKCGDRNRSHSCDNEAVQGSPQGAVLGQREVILISLVLLHSVLPPRWPSCLIPPSVSTTGGSREWGRQVMKIYFFCQ